MTMSVQHFRVLVVDDKKEHLEDLTDDLKSELSDLGHIEVVAKQSFEEAETELASPHSTYDVVVLDVMNGDPETAGFERSRGVELYRKISDIRWLPVVFYTGAPNECEGLESPPLVAIVEKDYPDLLIRRVRSALESGASRIARELLQKLDSRMRSFLGRHVAPNWSGYNLLETDEIERVLVGRLAAHLREWDAPGADGESDPIGHEAVPASYYLLPPVNGSGLRAGSILTNNDVEWWIVLTPTCDLFTNEGNQKQGEKLRTAKAHRVLLARLTPVNEHPKVANYVTKGTGASDAKKVLNGHPDESRWYYLPAFLEIPHLLVDLEYLHTEPHVDLQKPEWTRIADLDTPYIEALLARQSHWRGRIGKPDLDWLKQLEALRPAPQQLISEEPGS